MKHIIEDLLRAVSVSLVLSFAVTVAIAQKTDHPALAPPATSPADKAATQAFENGVKNIFYQATTGGTFRISFI